MTEFKDSLGRIWTLNLTLGSAKRILEKTGSDLLNPAKLTVFKDNGDVDVAQSISSRLITDDLFVAELVSVLVAKQLRERGLTEEEFLDSLDGAAASRAQDAFTEEYARFFTARRNAPAASLLEAIRTAIREQRESAPTASAGATSSGSQDAPESATAGSE